MNTKHYLIHTPYSHTQIYTHTNPYRLTYIHTHTLIETHTHIYTIFIQYILLFIRGYNYYNNYNVFYL